MAGAAYLFDGTTGGLISTVIGQQTNDRVGEFGIAQLTNGNYTINSGLWSNGSNQNAGAVTFGNATTGVSGVVSSSNSLVGSHTNDYVGQNVTALNNGNYLVLSSNWANGSNQNAGAVTFGNGTTGISGAVSSGNSLVGSHTNDFIGNGVSQLSNGNYLVYDSQWANGSATNAGAVTFGSGTTGVSGVITSANSLVGTQQNDQVGYYLTFLDNSNYLVTSLFWANGSVQHAGAVTFGNGTTGVSGVISSSNSLVGNHQNDQVGSDGITQLTNGNYVVNSSSWSGTRGAVTFGSGTTGVSGLVSGANSLVGSQSGDFVGASPSCALSNGNYVVNSFFWANGSVQHAGAVTFGNGTTGVSGVISSANSLVGTQSGDGVGSNTVALTNGNYVVDSYNWANGSYQQAGAVTFGNGTTGVSGAVSSSNSLVGTQAGDYIGAYGIAALTNGNYVVNSAGWSNGSNQYAGAVTFGNGTTGVSGAVSSSNSLVGTQTFDFVGSNGISTLTNGNYVVNSAGWSNGSNQYAGAVTFGNGTTGVSGAVSSSNSLVGTQTYDNVGSGGIITLTNGNYVVLSQQWANGSNQGAGAVTFGNGTTGVSGIVSSANSLVGSQQWDQIGAYGITTLSNGNYVVISPYWANGSNQYAGAVTFGNGSTGVSGVVSSSNSFVGTQADDTVGGNGITALSNGNYVFQPSPGSASAYANNLVVGNGNVGIVGELGAGNSYALGSGYTQISADTSNGRFLVSFYDSQSVYSVSTNFTSAGYSYAPGGNLSIDPAFITNTLNTGTSVLLQANNDITVNSDILANNPSGNGGALTLQAGRSILLNANITTDNGALSLLANQKAPSGVVDADRDAGAAIITMASGTAINAGTGAVTIVLDNGAGNTNHTSGAITLNTISANSIFAQSVSNTSDIILNGILTASGTGNDLTLAAGRNFLNNAGSGALMNAGSGRWLVYAANPADDLTALYSGGTIIGSQVAGGLTQTFNRYSCAYSSNGACAASATLGTTVAILTSGNGLIYSYTPTLYAAAAGNTVIYGDAANLTNYNYILIGYNMGDMSADSITGSLNGTSNYTQGSNVSSYTVDHDSGSLASALGYAISYIGSGNGLSAVARTITASLTGTVSKTYDGLTAAVLAGTNYSLSNLYSGDTTSAQIGVATTAGSYDMANVGTGKTVSVSGLTLNGTKANNYVLSSTTASGAVGTVTPRALTIAAGNESITYGDGNSFAGISAASVTGLQHGETLGGFSYTTNAANSTSGNWQATNGTPWTITASGGTGGNGFSAGNYSISYTAGAGNLTIGQKALTIVANDATKQQGAANPAFTVSYTNLITGDSVSGLNVVSPAIMASPAGIYSIIASGASNANYTISYVNGMLNVMPGIAVTIPVPAPIAPVIGSTLPATVLAVSQNPWVNSPQTSGVLTFPTSFYIDSVSALVPAAGITSTYIFNAEDGLAALPTSIETTIEMPHRMLEIDPALMKQFAIDVQQWEY